MKNKFNSNLYKKEITNLIKSSIEKLKREYPNYKVLTMSITSDFSSGISAVHFDSENFSKNYLQKEKEKYKYYLEKNDIEKAEIYKPTDEIRITNPAVHFDSENFSKNYLQKEKEKYKYYLEKNDIEKAEIYKPTDEIRITNPADFELAFYIEISHKSFSLEDFEDEENYEGYAILKEVLKENYDYIIKELKVNSNFELTYNNEEDWYNPLKLGE